MKKKLNPSLEIAPFVEALDVLWYFIYSVTLYDHYFIITGIVILL